MASASADQRPDGTWRARWREFPGGPQRSKHFPLKRDALRFLVDVQHDLARGVYIDPTEASRPFGELATLYLERHVWRPRTQASAATCLARAVEVWAERPVNTITRVDAQAFISGLPLAPSTIHLVRTHVGAVFKMAIDDGVIARNPFNGVKLPTVDKGVIEPLTVAEVHRLAEASPDWFAVAIVLGAGLGLRQSEARGVTVDRVRFLQREVRIDRQATKRGRDTWGPTKTPRGVRTIPVDDVVLERIATHLQRYGHSEHGHVLHRNGAMLTSDTLERQWNVVRHAAGLPRARYHDLRHHFASEQLAGGLAIPATAQLLGDTEVTVLTTYGHMVSTDDERARATMRRLWSQTAEDSLRTDDTSARR
jgi:integrase